MDDDNFNTQDLDLIEGISERGWPMIFALVRSFILASDADADDTWLLVNEFCMAYLELSDDSDLIAQKAYDDFREGVKKYGIKYATLGMISAMVGIRDAKTEFLESEGNPFYTEKGKEMN